MRKSLINIMVFAVIFSLVLSGVFCCCLVGDVQANIPAQSCHQDFQLAKMDHTSHHSHDSKNTQECKCEKIFGLNLNKSFNDFKSIATISQNLPIILPVHGLISDLSLSSLAYKGPPKEIPNSPVPIYLQISDFRL
jgi:hypothetical protein